MAEIYQWQSEPGPWQRWRVSWDWGLDICPLHSTGLMLLYRDVSGSLGVLSGPYCTCLATRLQGVFVV